MTALPYDFIQLEDGKGAVLHRSTCRENCFDWPPPQYITKHGINFKLESHSQIPDDIAAGLSHVARGALYLPTKDIACTYSGRMH